MIEGKRVVVWTPYGRERTVSILVEYLRRDHERGVVDEYWLYLNTDPDQVDDLRFAYDLARRFPWVRIVERPAGVPIMYPKQRNTGFAYRYMTDPDTVYIRMDDDLVYVHEDAFTNLVHARLQYHHSETAVTFGTCWNNAIVSWFMQQAGVIPYELGAVTEPYCMDRVGWASGEFAVNIHRFLLDRVELGMAESLFLYQDMPLRIGQQFSVSFFATCGEQYAALPGGPGVLVPDEEEHFHSVHWPTVLNRANILVGNALVSHFTFGPQRQLEPWKSLLGGEILDRYRALAGKLT